MDTQIQVKTTTLPQTSQLLWVWRTEKKNSSGLAGFPASSCIVVMAGGAGWEPEEKKLFTGAKFKGHRLWRYSCKSWKLLACMTTTWRPQNNVGTYLAQYICAGSGFMVRRLAHGQLNTLTFRANWVIPSFTWTEPWPSSPSKQAWLHPLESNPKHIKNARDARGSYLCHLSLHPASLQRCHGLLSRGRTVKVDKAVAYRDREDV